MEKELPIYKFKSFEFIVDVEKNEVREKKDPNKVYTIFDMDDRGDGYSFDHHDDDTGETVAIDLPPLVTLDPERMAAKYHTADLSGKSDFEVMVDQEILHRRILLGELPTVSIAGHTFYADARINLLRPKDDFTTLGICFSDLDHCYMDERNSYGFPYNPKTHQYQELDYAQVLEQPKDLLFIEIPHERILDPVGWNRRHGWPEVDALKETGLQLHFTAKIIPWHKTGIDELIAQNQRARPLIGVPQEKKDRLKKDQSTKNKNRPKM